jgi:hypothetical protein
VPGIGLDRIRQDRILHEALTAGADPLHLTLVFQLSPSTASRYGSLAQHILEDAPFPVCGTPATAAVPQATQRDGDPADYRGELPT